MREGKWRPSGYIQQERKKEQSKIHTNSLGGLSLTTSILAGKEDSSSGYSNENRESIIIHRQSKWIEKKSSMSPLTRGCEKRLFHVSCSLPSAPLTWFITSSVRKSFSTPLCTVTIKLSKKKKKNFFFWKRTDQFLSPTNFIAFPLFDWAGLFMDYLKKHFKWKKKERTSLFFSFNRNLADF